MFHYNRPDLRRCYYAGCNFQTSGTTGGFFLFNSSTGPELLVVRNWGLNSSVAGGWFLTTQQTKNGGTTLPIYPVVSGEPAPPAIATSNTSGPALANGYTMGTFYSGVLWETPYPFCVLTPGWSLCIQYNTTAEFINASVWFEVIHPQQLDPERWEQANINAALAANGG
jgi:hypothetical protein